MTIVGLWKDGELEMPPSPDTVLSETTVLVVAGTDEQFDNLKTYLTQPRVPTQYDTVVIAGAGATGTAAEEHLDKNNVSSVTIDTDESQNPDIVGDITKREVLEEAGIESAGGYIIAVSDDPDTLSSILLARHIRDDIEIAVSVLSNEAVRKAQQAGADYALSTPNVAGRLLAKEIQGLDYIDPTTQIRIAEVQAPKLVGKTLEEADVRSRTGCTVIAIERDGKTIVDVRPETDIQEDDELLVVGTDEEVHQFLSLFRGDDD